jgi:hypothetical protein
LVQPRHWAGTADGAGPHHPSRESTTLADRRLVQCDIGSCWRACLEPSTTCITMISEDAVLICGGCRVLEDLHLISVGHALALQGITTAALATGSYLIWQQCNPKSS